jgi:hypothetical protein
MNTFDLVNETFNMPVFDIEKGDFVLTPTKVVGMMDGCDLTGEIFTIERNGEEVDVSVTKFINNLINACEKFGEEKVLTTC